MYPLGICVWPQPFSIYILSPLNHLLATSSYWYVAFVLSRWQPSSISETFSYLKGTGTVIHIPVGYTYRESTAVLQQTLALLLACIGQACELTCLPSVFYTNPSLAAFARNCSTPYLIHVFRQRTHSARSQYLIATRPFFHHCVLQSPTLVSILSLTIVVIPRPTKSSRVLQTRSGWISVVMCSPTSYLVSRPLVCAVSGQMILAQSLIILHEKCLPSNPDVWVKVWRIE